MNSSMPFTALQNNKTNFTFLCEALIKSRKWKGKYWKIFIVHCTDSFAVVIPEVMMGDSY